MSNIQVVVRCRGRNDREIAAKSQVVVDLSSDTYSIMQPTVTVGKNSGQLAQKIISSGDLKTYNFDSVYGPLADQDLVFKKSVMPLFNDFLQGFNATVLAYGQTGTGKTYTMYGKNDFDLRHDGIIDESGIIPRVLDQLFRKLADSDDDFVVKCSFIELYNENLKDLLNDDADSKQALKIFENKKNPNSILISNLKEVYINDQKTGFDALKRGLAKRKVASTKLNDVSSRSHTIFTVSLFKRAPNHEELVRYSKINLVDLAGSENINKSGSMNMRAKEAASINQSLLTLGRVITSLSDRSTSYNANLNHVPYRESKLTRLLQDSIGGRTKTLLISTISPAKINLEETVSTLEYSLKVKNIENKPQLGSDFSLIMRKVMMRDLSNELIKLNNDLIATRSKTGIFMNETNYNNLIEENTSNKNEIGELKSKVAKLQTKLAVLEEKVRANETNESELREKVKVKDHENKRLDDKIEGAYHNVNESLDLLKQLRAKLDKQSATSTDIDRLNESLTQKLDSMKKNFIHNTGIIDKEVSSSILGKIPDVLQQLLKDLGQDNKSLANYKRRQNEIILKLTGFNNELNDYMLTKVLKEFNLDVAINSFIEDKVCSRLQEQKAQFVSRLSTVVNDEYQSIEGVFKTSMTQFSDQLIDSETTKMAQYMAEWNKKFNTKKQTLDDNLWKYEEDMKQLDSAQASLEKTSTEVVSLIGHTIQSNLHSFGDSFKSDHQQVAELVPRYQALHRQHAHTDVRHEVSGISANLHAITGKSPLRPVQNNVNSADPPKPTNIPSLHGKENDVKRRRLD